MNKRKRQRILKFAAAEFAAFGLPMKEYREGKLTVFGEGMDGGHSDGWGSGEVNFEHKTKPDIELRMSNITWDETGDLREYGENGGRLTL